MGVAPFKVLYPWCGQQLGPAVLTTDSSMWTAVNTPVRNGQEELPRPKANKHSGACLSEAAPCHCVERLDRQPLKLRGAP